MNILKNRQITCTQWQLDPCTNHAGESLPGNKCEDKNRITPLPQWLSAIDDLIAENPDYEIESLPGILLQPDDPISQLSKHLHAIPVIAINAGNFADGRIYSLAVELRQQHAYRGELRAIGATLDNLQLMERCGFDAFELKPEIELEEALQYFDELIPVYPYN